MTQQKEKAWIDCHQLCSRNKPTLSSMEAATHIYPMGIKTIVCGWDKTLSLLKSNDIGTTHFYL